MTPDQDKRLLEFVTAFRSGFSDYLHGDQKMGERTWEEYMLGYFRPYLEPLLAAQAQPSEQVRELVAAVQDLDPFRPRNVAFYQRYDDDTRDRVRKALAALAPSTETSDE